MTLTDDHGSELNGDDLLAAEYVLGVLAADQRQKASYRIDTDQAFARRVDGWEGRLAPMAAAYPEIAAPSWIKTAIDRQIFTQADKKSAKTSWFDKWAPLAFWRGLATGAVIAALFAIAVPFFNIPDQKAPAMLVASLAADNSDVKYLVVHDAASPNIALSHVSGERALGRDFELWMIEGDNAPVSMGIIPVGAAVQVAVSAQAQQKLAQGAVLAVSVEPAGGSPTGQPTGPVVAAGDLRSI